MRNLICFMFGIWTAGVTPAFGQDPENIDPAQEQGLFNSTKITSGAGAVKK